MLSLLAEAREQAGGDATLAVEIAQFRGRFELNAGNAAEAVAGMPSPTLKPVVLSDEKRSVLTGWVRRRKTAQALALRSRIVLRCTEGGSIGEVAAAVGVSRNTVSKWRSRFVADRLEGLSDEPRPDRPRLIIDDRGTR